MGKIRMIIDCDTGVDDALAIAYILANRQIDLIGITAFFFGGVFISTFIQDADPAAVTEIIAIGSRQFRVESLFYCLLAFSHAVAGICRGAGNLYSDMCRDDCLNRVLLHS